MVCRALFEVVFSLRQGHEGIPPREAGGDLSTFHDAVVLLAKKTIFRYRP
jgi:hypothetical protein